MMAVMAGAAARMLENRGRAKAALVDALPWRAELGGVVDVMLDYAARKPISFPIYDDPTDPVQSDGAMAMRKADDPGARILFAKCAHPLDVCVPEWSVCMAEDNADGPHYGPCIGLGVTSSASSGPCGFFVNLRCDRAMYAKQLDAFVGHDDAFVDQDSYLASAWVKRSDNHYEPAPITMCLPAAEVHAWSPSDPFPSSTVRIHVDVDANTITWTLSNGKTTSANVPRIGKLFAYVDLTLRSKATIIQLPHPWLF